MMETHLVRIDGERLRFSACHFITLANGSCEPLHGHDFRASADVQGPLDDVQCVVDFLALEALLREILDELDHRVLLPTQHPTIHLAEDAAEVEVRFADRRWVFPRAECLLLPMANTTAERLAEHLGRRLLEGLRSRLGVEPTAVRFRLEESPGCVAVWQWRGDGEKDE